LKNIDSDMWFSDEISGLRQITSKELYIDNIDEVIKAVSKNVVIGTSLTDMIDELDRIEEELDLNLDYEMMNDYIRYLCLFNPFLFGRKIEYEMFSQRCNNMSTPLIYKCRGTIDIWKSNKTTVKRVILNDDHKRYSILDFNVESNVSDLKKLQNRDYRIVETNIRAVTHKCYTKPMNTIQFYGHDVNDNEYYMNTLDVFATVDKLIRDMNSREVINRIYENRSFYGCSINNVARNYLCELIENYEYDEIVGDIIDAVKMEIVTIIGKDYMMSYYPSNMCRRTFIDKNTMMHFIDVGSQAGLLNLVYNSKSEYTIVGHNTSMFAYLKVKVNEQGEKEYKVKYSKLFNI